MNIFVSMNTELYRMNTALNNPPYVHRRKICSCGKQTSAKHLTQYGQCLACVRAAAKAAAA